MRTAAVEKGHDVQLGPRKGKEGFSGPLALL